MSSLAPSRIKLSKIQIHQSIEFVKGDPPDEYMCPICTFVAYKPLQLSCCGRIVCKGCLDRHRVIADNPSCPVCRYNIVKSFRDIRANRYIMQLEAYCIYKSSGCSWGGRLRDIERHLGECDHCEVYCAMCHDKKSMVRSNLNEHIRTCPMRQEPCPHCSKMLMCTNMKEHLDYVCQEKEMGCPNEGCNMTMKRKGLFHHRLMCGKEIVLCKYSYAGCKEKLRRDDMLRHEEFEKEYHLKLLSQQNYKQYLFKIPFEVGEENCHTMSWYLTPGGYKMSIQYNTMEENDGYDQFIEFNACIMRGENDRFLPWPFCEEITVTIEVLNQLEDKNHYKMIIEFDDTVPEYYRHRAHDDDDTEGWGGHDDCNYLYASDLVHNEQSNCQFIKDNQLYIRVSITEPGNNNTDTLPWMEPDTRIIEVNNNA